MTTIPAKADPSPRRLRGGVLHVARVCLFIAIIWLIHDQHRWYTAQQVGQSQQAVTIERVLPFLPEAATMGEWDPGHGGRMVLDGKGNIVGYVILTSPMSDSIVGYSGPTTTLLAFDNTDRIRGIDIIRSGDTVEHVADVKADKRFMTELNGLTWKQASQRRDVDAVSGATLTSLAVREGIVHRLGNEKPTTGRFPEAINLNEARRFFPTAASLAPSDASEGRLTVMDDTGRALGSVFRTSPAADATIGYQGPTDTLVALSREDKVLGILIRNSYDNEPYV